MHLSQSAQSAAVWPNGKALDYDVCNQEIPGSTPGTVNEKYGSLIWSYFLQAKTLITKFKAAHIYLTKSDFTITILTFAYLPRHHILISIFLLANQFRRGWDFCTIFCGLEYVPRTILHVSVLQLNRFSASLRHLFSLPSARSSSLAS